MRIKHQVTRDSSMYSHFVDLISGLLMGLRLLTKRKLLLLNKGRLQAVLRGDGASFKFLSLKARVDAALTLRLCVELRVTGGKFGMRRRICVIISPATLTTLVGHLRGYKKYF